MSQHACHCSTECDSVQDPQRAKGVLGGAAGLFQLRLLEAYLTLPDHKLFFNEHQGLSKLCTRAFRGSTAPTAAAPGVCPAIRPYLFI